MATQLPLNKSVDLVQLDREIADAHGWSDPPGLSLRDGELEVHSEDADAAKVRKAIKDHKPKVPRRKELADAAKTRKLTDEERDEALALLLAERGTG